MENGKRLIKAYEYLTDLFSGQGYIESTEYVELILDNYKSAKTMSKALNLDIEIGKIVFLILNSEAPFEAIEKMELSIYILNKLEKEKSKISTEERLIKIKGILKRNGHPNLYQDQGKNFIRLKLPNQFIKGIPTSLLRFLKKENIKIKDIECKSQSLNSSTYPAVAIYIPR